ncbi:MAG: hypothetical protein IIB57_11415, partial [Planctomycetes bacterium]|nr:hypothetical protein [Planctomycetota bacterium]
QLWQATESLAGGSQQTTLEYDARDRVTEIRRPNGTVQYGGYTDHDVPETVTLPGSGPAPATEYTYDPAGRIGSVENEWWTLVGGAYAKTPIVGTSAAYEPNLGLKTSTSFYSHDGFGGWQTDRTETYSYHPDTDYLTSVDYNDGLPNEVMTWSYDAAGNRISDSANPGAWSYDDLNRMTASPGATYFNDILGNRLGRTASGMSTGYGWDDVGRMTTYRPDIALNSSYYYGYRYRADGMRVEKVDSWDNQSVPVVTRFYYDAQMGIEDLETDGTNTTLRKLAIGARGIDMIAKTVNGGTEVKAFPLYDVHGNMVATLARDSGNGFTTGNVQSYDAWGGVRSGFLRSGSADRRGRRGFVYLWKIRLHLYPRALSGGACLR